MDSSAEKLWKLRARLPLGWHAIHGSHPRRSSRASSGRGSRGSVRANASSDTRGCSPSRRSARAWSPSTSLPKLTGLLELDLSIFIPGGDGIPGEAMRDLPALHEAGEAQPGRQLSRRQERRPHRVLRQASTSTSAGQQPYRRGRTGADASPPLVYAGSRQQ